MKNKSLAFCFVLTAIVVTFTSTHHAVYGHCHNTDQGKTCDLIKWVGNK